MISKEQSERFDVLSKMTQQKRST